MMRADGTAQLPWLAPVVHVSGTDTLAQDVELFTSSQETGLTEQNSYSDRRSIFCGKRY